MTLKLTDLGFGKPFTAELARGGEIVKKDFAVAESPPHYDSARRYKSPEAVGLTVRNLTFEVRRYFQKKPDDPGVIVSKVEPGSKAGVGGVRPFELITDVNDQPVSDVKAFEKLVKKSMEAGEEIRLSVKRMHKGRVVKLKIEADEDGEAKPDEPATRPAKAAEPDDDAAEEAGDEASDEAPTRKPAGEAGEKPEEPAAPESAPGRRRPTTRPAGS